MATTSSASSQISAIMSWNDFVVLMQKVNWENANSSRLGSQRTKCMISGGRFEFPAKVNKSIDVPKGTAATTRHDMPA